MSNKKLINVFLCMVVVMLCFSYATMAWTSMNRKVWSKNQTMTIQSVSNITTLSCYALRYDGICGTACYKIGLDEEHGEVTNVTMTEYDKIFRDRNVNTPMIFVLEIGNVPNRSGDYITIKVPCNTKYILPENGTPTNHYVTSDERYTIQKYISNVISVKLSYGGSITLPTPTREDRIENNVTIFTTQVSAFENITTGEQVGTLASASTENGATTYNKTGYIELIIRQSDYTSSLFDGTDESGTSKHLILYIEFDYDDHLMDTFIDQINENDDNTSFLDDIGTMLILTGREGS